MTRSPNTHLPAEGFPIPIDKSAIGPRTAFQSYRVTFPEAGGSMGDAWALRSRPSNKG
jgi:hypothetical protein